MPLDCEIIGQGVYSPREASRLIGTTPQNVLRWTRGSGPTEPLWKAHYQFLEDSTEISFVDLIELRIVSGLRRAGVSLQSIRFAIGVAQQKFGIDRPFASRNFRTDGIEILMDSVENDGEYVSLSKSAPGQKVFRQIVDQSLRDMEYDGDLVARWRPEKYNEIVIDPLRAFGDPLLDEFGISTRTLFTEYQDFKDKKYLSQIYEVPISAIRRALAFEQSLENQSKKSDGQSSF